jgi:predicted nucleotidyltransferase
VQTCTPPTKKDRHKVRPVSPLGATCTGIWLTTSLNRFTIYQREKMPKKNDLNDIIMLLKKQKPFLKKEYKVNQIGIFGSYVRGDQYEDSDIDILIDKAEAIGLLKLANLQNYLSRLIGIDVDLVLKKNLKPHIGRNILNEVIYV